MKILIMGTGGIGGYYGGRLLEAGADVIFVARGRHLEALQSTGLKITSVNGDFEAKQVQATSNPKDIGPVDIVLHCTKTWDLDTAAELFEPAVGSDTVIVTTQNGIDNVDRLSQRFDRQQITGGIAYGVVQIAGPGHIDHSSKDVHKLIFGPMCEQQHERLRSLHDLCGRANFDCVWSDSIEKDLWSKFLFICAYSGVTSLTRTPIGPIVDDPETLALYEGCMREIETLAQKKGIALDPNIIANSLQFSRNLEKTATSSMQRDLEQGKWLEVDTLNGTVAKLGEQMSIATPINQFIFTALKLHAKGAE